jgi:hypothetical protein
MLPDPLEHTFYILEHMTILQPQHRQARGPEKSLARLIASTRLLAIVRRPFQFDDEPLARAIEVDDVTTDAVLSPEFSPVQLRTLKHTPQCRFRGRQART